MIFLNLTRFTLSVKPRPFPCVIRPPQRAEAGAPLHRCDRPPSLATMSQSDASSSPVRPVAAARRKMAVGAPPARRGRPPKALAKAGGETRDLILDAAEDLFSKHGFYGVTIR